MTDQPSRLERRMKRKEERQAQVAQQRDRFHRRERNKRIFNYAIIAVVVLAIGYFVYTSFGPEEPGQHDAFAQCLTAEGATMYGTDWCPHCQEQKRMFGASFQHIAYVNCDYNRAACDAAGVQGYPTWMIKGRSMSGTQQLQTLAEATGCTLQ